MMKPKDQADVDPAQRNNLLEDVEAELDPSMDYDGEDDEALKKREFEPEEEDLPHSKNILA